MRIRIEDILRKRKIERIKSIDKREIGSEDIIEMKNKMGRIMLLKEKGKKLIESKKIRVIEKKKKLRMEGKKSEGLIIGRIGCDEEWIE